MTNPPGVYTSPPCGLCGARIERRDAPTVTAYVLISRDGQGVPCCPSCWAQLHGEQREELTA